MKFLKGLLFFIIILLVAALLAALFAPGTKIVEREIVIDAPQSKVFIQVAKFENWTNWDPWYSRDTNQIRNYTGTLGDESYGYNWKSSNKEVGKGEIKVLSIEGKEKINYELIFSDGNSKRKALGSFSFDERDEKTKVTWSMISKMSYPLKIINYFMDGLLGPDFEKGLGNLKRYVENLDEDESTSTSSGVQITTEHGINYAIIKADNLAMSDMEMFFAQSYPLLYGYTQTNGLTPKGPSRGLFYDWNEENGTTTLAAAVPISDLLLEEGVETNIEIGNALLKSRNIEYVQLGGYSASKSAHGALLNWIEGNDKELLSPIVEEYIKGPFETKDSNQFETRIIYYFD